eukprot:Colp12_sorted_trinity150504_noHs@2744
MTGTKAIALGWAAFAGTHMAMSHPPIREGLIQKLGGKDKFLSVYSAVSFATLLPTIAIYARRGSKAVPLFHSGKLGRYTSKILTAAAIVTFPQVVTAPSAIVVKVNEGATAVTEDQVAVKGIHRVTRHGMFMSFALWGLGRALAVGSAPALVFYGGFPIFWIIGSMHQDLRLKQTLPTSFFEQTSLLPFKAISEGRNILPPYSELNEKALGASLLMLVPLVFL